MVMFVIFSTLFFYCSTAVSADKTAFLSVSHYTRNEAKTLHGVPVFKDIFENVTVEESETLEILCSATGDQPITYDWLDPDENEISSDTSEIIHKVLSDGGSSLKISQVNGKHQGAYTCTASNEYGLASRFFNIIVKDKGSKNDTDTNGSASIVDVIADVKNDSISFKIYTTGSVDTIFVWYSEFRLPRDGRLKWKFEGVGPYEIKNLTASGKYSFQFKLSESDDWSKVYTYVLLPDIPHVIFSGLSDGALKIEWFITLDNIVRGTIDKHELSYYTVSQLDGNTWVKDNCTVTIEIPKCGLRSYTITPLYKNSYYEIRLRAHTSSGYGEYYYFKVHA